jgi:hypothetical protein
MLRRVALVRTEVSEALSSSETSVLTRATRRNIPADAILHSHRRENLKSYKKIEYHWSDHGANLRVPHTKGKF